METLSFNAFNCQIQLKRAYYYISYFKYGKSIEKHYFELPSLS